MDETRPAGEDDALAALAAEFAAWLMVEDVPSPCVVVAAVPEAWPAAALREARCRVPRDVVRRGARADAHRQCPEVARGIAVAGAHGRT